MDELNLMAIIETFNFKKIEQSELEDSVCEYYQIEVKGIERTLIIEVQVQHHREEPDEYIYYLLSSTQATAHKVRLNIESAFDLTMVVNLLNKPK